MKILAWPAFKTRVSNPYNYLLYSNMPEWVEVKEFSLKSLLLYGPDIIHLHWPSETITRHNNFLVATLRTIIFFVLLKYNKLLGSKILQTVHDNKAHSVLHPRLYSLSEKLLSKLVDNYIKLDNIPHGHYKKYYSLKNKKTFSSQLRLLYLGYIEDYKNVPELIRVIRDLPNVSLTIAGKPQTKSLKDEILLEASKSSNVILHLQFVPEKDLNYFFQNADISILPFKTILNSGSTLLALSANTPVIVPNKGIMPYWKKKFGNKWIRTYENFTLKEIKPLLYKNLDTDILDLTSLEWKGIAHQTHQYYEDCLLN